MARIISGYAGSLRLDVPSQGTRPTTDRVREAIFSALDARGAFGGARVLDLYAGSGALGLEAASRGAVEVTLVDRAGGAQRALRRNAELVRRAAPRGTAPEISVIGQPAHGFLSATTRTWDLVFIDPPYDLGGVELSRELVLLTPRLSPDAVVVVERSARDPEPEWPAGLALERRKDYGETAVYWVAPGG